MTQLQMDTYPREQKSDRATSMVALIPQGRFDLLSAFLQAKMPLTVAAAAARLLAEMRGRRDGLQSKGRTGAAARARARAEVTAAGNAVLEAALVKDPSLVLVPEVNVPLDL